MEPKDLSNLPFVFQIIAGFGLFFGTFMLAIGGWLWKTIKPKLPTSITDAVENPPPTVIVGAALADSHSIGKLASTIEKLIEVLTDNGEDTERGLDRNHKRLGDMCDELTRTNEILVRLERHMKDRTIL